MIWAVGALLTAGVAAGPSSALLLARGRWQIIHPRRALTLWGLLGALGVLCATASVLLAAALSLSAGSAGAADQAAAPGWTLALTLFAWAGLGGLGIAGSLAVQGRGDLGDENGEWPTAAELLSRRRTDSWRMGTITVVEIDDPRLVAASAPDPASTIFVSRGVRRALPASQLEAVLAHEAAHLHQRHAAVRYLGAWHSACLPKRSRLRRRLASRVMLLTELAADDHASAVVGPGPLHGALCALRRFSSSRELGVRAARVRALHGLDAKEAEVTHPTPAVLDVL